MVCEAVIDKAPNKRRANLEDGLSKDPGSSILDGLLSFRDHIHLIICILVNIAIDDPSSIEKYSDT